MTFIPLKRFIKQQLRGVQRWQQTWRNSRTLREQLSQQSSLNIVIGAGGTHYDGWINTDQDTLDITRAADWARWFTPNSIQRILSEHVFEHLTEAENATAFGLAYQHLALNGRFRIAVPDGNRPDEVYRNYVMPPADGHQMYFTIEKMTSMLQQAGFTVLPLEYFDAKGQFHAVEWDVQDGMIGRSVRFDHREKFRFGEVHYTSLLVDALKV